MNQVTSNDDRFLILTPEQKQAEKDKHFAMTVNQIMTHNMVDDIMALDTIAEKDGMDKAFEHVGTLLRKAIGLGLVHTKKKIGAIEKKFACKGLGAYLKKRDQHLALNDVQAEQLALYVKDYLKK